MDIDEREEELAPPKPEKKQLPTRGEKPHERMIKRLITQPKVKENTELLKKKKVEFLKKNRDDPKVFDDFLHPQQRNEPITKGNLYGTEDNVDNLKAKLQRKHQSKIEEQLSEKWRMCTEKEGKLREESRQLDIFERDPKFLVNGKWADDLPRAKAEWCVKKYSRSDAGKDYEEPFSLEVLGKTLEYILENIIDVDNQKDVRYATKLGQDKHDFFDIYDFVYDRFRSINKDLTVLNLETKRETIEVINKKERFLTNF